MYGEDYDPSDYDPDFQGLAPDIPVVRVRIQRNLYCDCCQELIRAEQLILVATKSSPTHLGSFTRICLDPEPCLLRRACM